MLKNKITRRRRLIILLLLVCSLCIVGIGPWPVDDTPYTDTSYAHDTLAPLQTRQYPQQALPLFGGFASADITPAPGSPMGGYSARDPKENQGALSPVYAKAITISNGTQQVTLLGAELLLPMPELVDEVSRLSHIPREQLFFTATHTHSGPGGYAHGLVEQQTLGEFNASYFRQLTQSLADIARQSRSQQQPISLRYQRLDMDAATADSFVYNQLHQDGHNERSSLHWLQMRDAQNQPLANLITFNAHATFLGKLNHQISGDYPGLLQSLLEKQLNSPVLFASGGVGGALPIGHGKIPDGEVTTQLAQMQDMSDRLVQWFAQQKQQAQWQADQAVLDVALIPVELPSQQFRIGDQWRLSPLLVGAVFHDRNSYIHALRIGPLFLFGQPADYANELTQRLEQWGQERGVYTWVTGFNGDYIGYLMPADRYDQDHYTVRKVNFFGRWAGDYLNEVCKTFIQQATNN